MDVIWGPGSTPAGETNTFYAGLDVARSGKTVTVEAWVKGTYPVSNDTQTATIYRDGSSVATRTHVMNGPAAVQIGADYSFTGAANTTYAIKNTVTAIYNGATPTVTVNVTIPPDAPAAPTGLTVTRVSDTQHTVTWTNNATSAAPYTNVVVERWVDEGSYAAVATLGGAVTSYSATTSADHKYSFRVKATNSSGSSSYAYPADFTYTTPAAPTIGSAARVGSDIQVTWDHTARWPTGAKVYASQNGGTYSLLATVGTTAETYTHAAPSTAVTWTYKVAATNGSLESAQSSASNTVLLLAPPLAPTALTPTVADAAEAITFQWQHNPTDTTAQTAYELQYRPSGGAWVTLTGTTAQTRTLTAGTLTNGLTYEWQVRTKGSHATFSPYSALASFPTSARPTATINIPTATHGESSLTATWGYFDAESTAQSQWRATLTNGTTTEVLSGSGTATAATFATVLPDASTWDVTVEVRDGAGLWSTPDTVTFTVAYAPPPTPVLTALYNAPTGSTALTVTNPAPVAPEVATDHNNLYRSLDAGTTWVLIGDALPENATMVDPLPLVGGVTLYRVAAVSATPSSATSTDVELDTTSETVHQGWCFANWGDGFVNGIRLWAEATVKSQASREKVLQHWSDRPDPVEYAGSPRYYALAITARLSPVPEGDGDSTWQDLEALADVPAPICWRDPTGRRVFVSSGRAGTSAETLNQFGSLELTRVDHRE